MFKTIGPLMRQYLIVITVNLSVLATGLGLIWPSPVLVKLRNATETVLPAPITEEQGSWIVSIGFLTGMAANLLAAFLVDRIGRKYTIFLACLPRIAVGFLFLYAKEVWMILLGRAILGAVDSFVFNVVPMYASEVASKEIRGSLGTILQIMCSIGVVTMLSVGPFVSYVTLNTIYTTFVVVTTLPLAFLPDSPYFLFSKGRNEEAVQVLTFLRGSESKAHEELKEYATNNSDGKASLEILKNKTFWKSFGLVVALGAGGHLSGFNSVSFYLQTILESTQTSVMPEIASVVIGMIQLFASFCTTMVTDRFGRKTILSVTISGIALGMLGLGGFFFAKNNGTISGVMNYIPLISLILVVYSYSAGVGSINWVLQAELFDDRSRGIGLSISSLLSFIFIFVATKYFPLLILSIGPAATYWFFSFNNVIYCLFIIFCIPETKGKSIGEIQTSLGARKNDDEKDDKL